MKTTIIIQDNIKQVMFTPECESDKKALQMIQPSDQIELAIMQGNFISDPSIKPLGLKSGMCLGGYLRAWADDDSIMLVMTPKIKQADLDEKKFSREYDRNDMLAYARNCLDNKSIVVLPEPKPFINVP